MGPSPTVEVAVAVIREDGDLAGHPVIETRCDVDIAVAVNVAHVE